MNKTDNFDLNLPEYTDTVDIGDLNENFEMIDAELHDTHLLIESLETEKVAKTSIVTGQTSSSNTDTQVQSAKAAYAEKGGALSSLKTTNKTIVPAINEIKDSVDALAGDLVVATSDQINAVLEASGF
jgi:hypothetical protein